MEEELTVMSLEVIGGCLASTGRERRGAEGLFFRERKLAKREGERAVTGYVARAGEEEMVSASTCICLCFCKFSTLFSSSPRKL